MNYQSYLPHKNLILPRDKKIVLVGGCFDILHYGHMQFLQKSREMGDYLVIALEPDERIIQYKNRQPIHTQQERASNLCALRCVDQIVLLPLLNGFEDYFGLVKKIDPAIISVTNGDPQLLNKQKQADAIHALLVVATDRIEPFSSSTIYQHHKDIEKVK